MHIKPSIKILFLFSDYTGYFKSCIQALRSLYHVELIGVRKFFHPDAPHRFETKEFKQFLQKGDYRYEELLKICLDFSPSLVYVAGWEDKDFLKISLALKNRGAFVVTGMDNQWKGTIKQRLGHLYFRLYLKRYFTHAWVAGHPQFEFARNLGFEYYQIIDSLYSADLNIFKTEADPGRTSLPKELLFVGRLKEIKGIHILYKVFNELTDQERNGWVLRIVGNGELKSAMPPVPGKIIVDDFMPPKALVEVAKHCGGFCLPSLIEPWGVVVHEFSATGLPLLLSNIVGAATTFLIPGYNGFMFEANNAYSLKVTLVNFFHQTPEKILEMGNNSRELSKLITPELWSHKLMSLLHTPNP